MKPTLLDRYYKIIAFCPIYRLQAVELPTWGPKILTMRVFIVQYFRMKFSESMQIWIPKYFLWNLGLTFKKSLNQNFGEDSKIHINIDSGNFIGKYLKMKKH